MERGLGCLAIGGQSANPDSGGRGLAEMHGAAGGSEGHGLIVFALFDFHASVWTKTEVLEKLQELRIFFVDAENFRAVVGTQVGKKNGSLARSEEHTSELQSLRHLVCRLLLEKKKMGADI